MTPAEIALLVGRLALEWKVSEDEARRRLMKDRMDLADVEWERVMDKKELDQLLRTAGGKTDVQVLLRQDGTNGGTAHSGSNPPHEPTVSKSKAALGKPPSSVPADEDED